MYSLRNISLLFLQSIKEGLSGVIKLQLFENNNLLYEDTGTHAGLEIMMQEV
jgi:hypothetical protein